MNVEMQSCGRCWIPMLKVLGLGLAKSNVDTSTFLFHPSPLTVRTL